MTRRTAVVTGAARGIGFHTASALARNGHRVAILDIRADQARQAAESIASESGYTTLGLEADVTDEASIDAAFSTVETTFGPTEILVNNAGVITPEFRPAEHVTSNEFDQMLSVHLRGAFVCSSRAIPLMKDTAYGRIIMLSSLVGPLGFAQRVAYASAKAGVEGLMRSLAIEGGSYGITVNAVAPGWIKTPIVAERIENGTLDQATLLDRTALRRWGSPDDVAAVIAELVGASFDYVTGAVIPVDGGYAMRGDTATTAEPNGAA